MAIRGNSLAAEPNEKVKAPIGWRNTRRQYGPEPRALVVRGGEHRPFVWAKDSASNRFGVTSKRGQKLATFSFPEPRGIIVRCGEHASAVRNHRDKGELLRPQVGRRHPRL
jgi:hypothetical protein